MIRDLTFYSRMNYQWHNSRRREQRVQRYFLLILRQRGRQQSFHCLSTSIAYTLPRQKGQVPGACCLPSSCSFSSHTHASHILYRSPCVPSAATEWGSAAERCQGKSESGKREKRKGKDCAQRDEHFLRAERWKPVFI